MSELHIQEMTPRESANVQPDQREIQLQPALDPRTEKYCTPALSCALRLSAVLLRLSNKHTNTV
ncbi:MAG: hypothetical protein M3R24_16485 [Chloroflexota bacterium]|nr:hypothetical protein [Chloroflexota bacterium]PLS78891.1 MAG: hypothetical protein CYG59_16100 [Chloroflexota bacterium]